MTVSPRALRLVPVPRPAALPVQPTTATAAFQGTLALELVPPAAPPAMPAAPSWDTDDDEPPPTPDPRGLPEPRRWSAVLAQAVVEILAGRRPAAQVLRWVDPAVYERVRRSAEATAARGRGGGVPVRVRRVRVGTSPDGPVEAVVVLDDGARCRSLALRLEPLDGRWLCTALDVV